MSKVQPYNFLPRMIQKNQYFTLLNFRPYIFHITAPDHPALHTDFTADVPKKASDPGSSH